MARMEVIWGMGSFHSSIANAGTPHSMLMQAGDDGGTGSQKRSNGENGGNGEHKSSFLFRFLRWLRYSVFEIRYLDLSPLSRSRSRGPRPLKAIRLEPGPSER